VSAFATKIIIKKGNTNRIAALIAKLVERRKRFVCKSRRSPKENTRHSIAISAAGSKSCFNCSSIFIIKSWYCVYCYRYRIYNILLARTKALIPIYFSELILYKKLVQ
jgi:hypothetical protein